jgi:uncharacterized membrane protein YozB (DUF420 family)
MFELQNLAHLNAVLNATSGSLLVAGYIFIRRHQIERHRACMIGAATASALFLTSYVIYHANIGSKPFAGHGPVRYVYFAILLTHVTMAIVVTPMAITTLRRGLKARYDAHVRIARRTFPLWLYVSVSGIVVYLMLYQWK